MYTTAATTTHRPLRTGLAAFWRALPQIALFELVLKGALVLLAKPLLAHCTQLLLQATGSPLAFNERIWQFALSPAGLIAIILAACFGTLLAFFEFSVLCRLAQQATVGEKASLPAALAGGFVGLRCLRGPGFPGAALYMLGLLPLANLGLASSLLPALRIPNFIVGGLSNTLPGRIGLVAFGVVVLALFTLLVFVLPCMAAGGMRFGAAALHSVRSLFSGRAASLRLMGAVALLWLVLAGLPALLGEGMFGLAAPTLKDALAYTGLTPRLLVTLPVWLALTLARCSLLPLLLCILTTAVLPTTQAPGTPPTQAALCKALTALGGKLQHGAGHVRAAAKAFWGRLSCAPLFKRRKRLVCTLAAALCLWGISGSFFTAYAVHDAAIIGHRGSDAAVENTLEAIQHAIDAGADYVEVDVQLSADGVPVVVHDANLTRLSGQNRNVWALTAEELAAIELRQNGHTGHIPTLAAVAAYCEGKIPLAVEYKPHGHEARSLVQATMEVLGSGAYAKSCLFLSMEYALVQQMKRDYPAHTTGYCVYGNIGLLRPAALREMNIDFLLVEETMASEALVANCREADLPVYVWTVNDTASMEDYLALGVAGLVTDRPAAASEAFGGMAGLSFTV